MPLNFPDTYPQLPIYLLVDTSGSMMGAPIQAVSEGLEMFEKALKDHDEARTTARVSIITFDSDARQIEQMKDADSFKAPALSATGSTALSRGLDVLREAIQREMRPKTEDYPGDGKPLVFLFTDGYPNPGDPWREAKDKLLAQKGRRPSAIVAIGAGEVDEECLRDLAPESTYLLQNLDREKVKGLFQWIANSTVVASQRVSQGVGTPAVQQMLAAPPPNLFATQP